MDPLSVSSANKRPNNNVNYPVNGQSDQQRSDINNSGQTGGQQQSSNSGPGVGVGVGGGGGQQMGSPQAPGNQSQGSGQPTYSIPGIVHYLQYEWQRFETQRQQWEVCHIRVECLSPPLPKQLSDILCLINLFCALRMTGGKGRTPGPDSPTPGRTQGSGEPEE